MVNIVQEMNSNPPSLLNLSLPLPYLNLHTNRNEIHLRGIKMVNIEQEMNSLPLAEDDVEEQADEGKDDANTGQEVVDDGQSESC